VLNDSAAVRPSEITSEPTWRVPIAENSTHHTKPGIDNHVAGVGVASVVQAHHLDEMNHFGEHLSEEELWRLQEEELQRKAKEEAAQRKEQIRQEQIRQEKIRNEQMKWQQTLIQQETHQHVQQVPASPIQKQGNTSPRRSQSQSPQKQPKPITPRAKPETPLNHAIHSRPSSERQLTPRSNQSRSAFLPSPTAASSPFATTSVEMSSMIPAEKTELGSDASDPASPRKGGVIVAPKSGGILQALRTASSKKPTRKPTGAPSSVDPAGIAPPDAQIAFDVKRAARRKSSTK